MELVQLAVPLMRALAGAVYDRPAGFPNERKLIPVHRQMGSISLSLPLSLSLPSPSHSFHSLPSLPLFFFLFFSSLLSELKLNHLQVST